MAHYPAVFDVARPPRFERVHIALRVVIFLVLGFVGMPLGWLFMLLYLALPAVAAVYVSSRGPERFLGEIGPRVARFLRFVAALYAYLMLLTDRFPADSTEPVRYDVQPTGRPTVGGALLRLITSIPEALVLAILAFVSGIVWLIAAIFVLVRNDYPPSLYAYQRGVLRWQSRLLAYHASLVEAYPPLAFDTGPEPQAGAPAEG